MFEISRDMFNKNIERALTVYVIPMDDDAEDIDDDDNNDDDNNEKDDNDEDDNDEDNNVAGDKAAADDDIDWCWFTDEINWQCWG